MIRRQPPGVLYARWLVPDTEENGLQMRPSPFRGQHRDYSGPYDQKDFLIAGTTRTIPTPIDEFPDQIGRAKIKKLRPIKPERRLGA